MARLEQPMVAPSFFRSSPNLGEVDAKIQDFKHQIDLIQGEIRRLEEYKNTRLLTVSKLPPEVLSMVFESLALEATPHSYYTCDAYKHLLPATQVCRPWRQVALDSPRIWGCIFGFASPRIVELFLERAKSAPLYLVAPGYYSNEKTLLAVLNHLDRLKEINLGCKPEWVKRIISEPTPQLEVITLKNASQSSPDALQFLADAFPVLQHLSLTGYTLQTRRTASLTNLRSLIIKSDRHGGNSSRTDTVELFTMLNDLALLSSLTLIDALAPLGGPVSPLSVDLPSLRHLSIQDNDISNLGMVSCIIAPLIKTIQLIHSGRADAEIATPIIAAIYSKLPNVHHSHSAFMLHATQYSDSHAHVRMWVGRTIQERESDTAFFDLRVSGTGDLQTEGAVLTLCPSNDLPPILHIHSDVESFNDDSLDTQRERILPKTS
ncbi:hypothetical protein BDN71DRAFT_1014098 [Pleurotus eryngii]|uniref:F-box domain-containing protein n=1 Tax=Pleurotus eryngii TaxID=5323 RepID=A0A9P6DF46_PLEER|nr:hypothetical protein BDN71DRAFT_1014098 [Pleurotus eryngii]